MKRSRIKGVFVCSSSRISEPVLNQVNNHFSQLAKSKKQRMLNRWNALTKATAAILFAGMFSVSCSSSKPEKVVIIKCNYSIMSSYEDSYKVKKLSDHTVTYISKSRNTRYEVGDTIMCNF